jgi:hypothetical protein
MTVLADGLKNINHVKKKDKSLVLIGPRSNISVWFPTVMMQQG